MNRKHRKGCAGWEDCDCFHITVDREQYGLMMEVIAQARAISQPIEDTAEPALWQILARREKLRDAVSRLEAWRK